MTARPGSTQRHTADDTWMTRAACRGLDPNIFYPAIPHGPEAETVRRRTLHRARAICDPCPVHEACRDYAETTREEHGIWAGQHLEIPTRQRYPRKSEAQ